MRFGGRRALLAGAACGLGGLGMAGMAMPAAAQERGAEAESDAIVVLADKLEESVPEELAKYGSRLEVIEGKAIDEGGYVDAAGALQYLVPGLFLTPKSGAFDYVQVSLAGARTSEVLFLVDGVRINNRLYASTSPLDSIPANMIERIEVLKGGQSLYYGTQAVGGIVNIITKSFTRETDAAIEAGYDTNEGYHLSGMVRGGTGDHYFAGFASRDQAEGFQAFRDEDRQPSAVDRRRGYQVSTVGGKYAFEPSAAFRLSASYQHNWADVEFTKAEDILRNANERNEEIASLKIDWSPSARLDVYLKGYYHDWDTGYLDQRPTVDPATGALGGVVSIYDGEKWGYEDMGLNLLAEYRLNEQLALVGGFDYQKYSGYDDVFLIAPTEESVSAPFAQVKLDLGDLSLAAGVRHNMPSDGQKKTVWNVSGRYGAEQGLYARGQVGTSFRLPTAYELYVVDPCCEQGNPNLVAEKSFNVEGGLGFARGAASVELIGFYRKVDDLIGITYDLPAYPDGYLINTPGRVKVWGGEAVASARLSEALSVTVDYTHTEAEQSGSGDQLVNIPRDQAKLMLNAQASGGRFGGNLAVNWVGDLWANPGGLGRTDYGNRAVVEVSAYAFLDSERRHRINARLENALDADYDTNLTAVREDIAPFTRYIAGYRGTPITLHVGYKLAL